MTDFAYPNRVAIAVLAIAAATIRFSTVPAHDSGRAIVLALAGWAGFLLAIAVSLRPSRAVVGAGAVMYAAFIVVWLASGPTSSFTENAQIGIEVALVGACAIAFAIPTFGGEWASSTFAMLSIAPMGVLVLATAAVVAPVTSASTIAAPVKSKPAKNAVPAKTKTDTKTKTTFGSGLSDTGNADEQAELKPNVPLGRAEQQHLAAQLVIARAAAMKYPTVGDAKRAGMILAGGMAPGVGAHYLAIATTLLGVKADGTVNAAAPGSYIYAGTRDDSPIVGLMYESLSTEVAPTGFAGPNDHWHRHSNLCIQYKATGIAVPFPPDSDVTQAQCQAVHGQFMAKSIWMVHAWVVPGYESPKGVFSHNNNDVHCPDGTNGVDHVGFCVHN